MELAEIVDLYGTPPADLVSKLDKGKGVFLDYVGHADVNKMLIAIDPNWTWEPVAWIEGRPAIHIHDASMTYRDGTVKETRVATMWGFMTVLGKSLPCVGSAPADKEDVEKELVGDLIRNGAMRFGICINLWSKSDEQPQAPQVIRTTGNVTITEPAGLASEKQKGLIRAKYKAAGKAAPNLDSMSKRDASQLIEKLMAGDAPSEDTWQPVYNDDEEPF